MTDQTTADFLADLRGKAAAASPGPWYASRAGVRYEEGNHVFSQREPDDDDSHDIATTCWSREDADYIAAASPDVIVRLLTIITDQAAAIDRAGAHVLRSLADTMTVGANPDDDSDYWRGYRAAQRELIHTVTDRADELDSAVRTDPGENNLDLIHTAVVAMTRMVTNETHAWNLWNFLNTNDAFVRAFTHVHRAREVEAGR